MILGIGFDDPFLVGLIGLGALLGLVLVGVRVVFAATAAVFSRVAIPEMLRHGYDKKLAAGVVAAGGTLASLIPPSAILVIYAIIVEDSVGELLLAGFLPGAVSALIYAAIIIAWALYRPDDGPSVGGYSWGERIKSLPGVSPIFVVVVIIMSAIYQGWATPTEAGALGAMVVFVIALLRGTGVATIRDALMEAAKLTVISSRSSGVC